MYLGEVFGWSYQARTEATVFSISSDADKTHCFCHFFPPQNSLIPICLILMSGGRKEKKKKKKVQYMHNSFIILE